VAQMDRLAQDVGSKSSLVRSTNKARAILRGLESLRHAKTRRDLHQDRVDMGDQG
jgi:hypothetical protein